MGAVSSVVFCLLFLVNLLLLISPTLAFRSFNSSEGIIVIGATNFPESLDKALTRPGRFDHTIAIPAPDVKGRKEVSIYVDL